MAYSWGPPAPAIPFIADHRYSSLHQERSYLLSALAAEESRYEYLSRTLENIKAKLQLVEAQENSVAEIRKLRKEMSTITRKLKTSCKCERAMANNLASVTAHMHMLEQNHWRKAQFEYTQRMRLTPIAGMTLGFQDTTLEPPLCPSYAYPCMPYSSIASAMPPCSVALPSLPARPSWQPQLLVGAEDIWNTQLPIQYYKYFQTPLATSIPFNTQQVEMLANWQAHSRDRNGTSLQDRSSKDHTPYSS